MTWAALGAGEGWPRASGWPLASWEEWWLRSDGQSWLMIANLNGCWLSKWIKIVNNGWYWYWLMVSTCGKLWLTMVDMVYEWRTISNRINHDLPSWRLVDGFIMANTDQQRLWIKAAKWRHGRHHGHDLMLWNCHGFVWHIWYGHRKGGYPIGWIRVYPHKIHKSV